MTFVTHYIVTSYECARIENLKLACTIGRIFNSSACYLINIPINFSIIGAAMTAKIDTIAIV